jgi:hypothetical protein
MPFSGISSPLRHRISAAALAPVGILCPFRAFFLPLGISAIKGLPATKIKWILAHQNDAQVQMKNLKNL